MIFQEGNFTSNQEGNFTSNQEGNSARTQDGNFITNRENNSTTNLEGNSITYQDAIEFITNATYLGSKLGLERLQCLLLNMGNPEKRLKYIHVAGTNGKGSTAAMISSILISAGYKVGLFTSPFLLSYKEQLKINNEEIREEKFAKVTAFVKKSALNMTELPTEFERVTAIAFQYFYEERCDFVVLEVGLGGKEDATNVIPVPEVAVITNIGLDHTQFLGNTLEEIAVHKAGIIKTGGQVVCYEQSKEVLNVLEDICHSKKGTLTVADFSKLHLIENDELGQLFTYKDHKNLYLTLLGKHQRENASVAIEAIEGLNRLGYSIQKDTIKEGLQKVSWPARFELLSKNPTVILDGGHNAQCMATVVDILKERYQDKQVIFVTGVMADKDYESMFSLIAPFAKEFIAVQPNNIRALKLEELEKVLKKYSRDVYASITVTGGLQLALSHATREDVIIVLGSLYMAGEVRNYFLNGK